jgi:hypothetical protein
VAPNFAALAAPAVALEADCKSCCHLAACTSNHGSKAAASSPAHVEVAAVLVEPLPQLVVSTGALVAVSVHVQAFFPNAPPGESQGRSPPFRLS